MNEQYINMLLSVCEEINNAWKLLYSITMQVEDMITNLQLEINEDPEGTNEFYEGGNG